MTQAELDRLRSEAEEAREEQPMTRVAIDSLANEDTIRRQLQTEFERHLRAHESTEQFVRRIQRITDSTAARAKTIAQTERTRAANASRYAQAIEDYVKQYEAARAAHRKRPPLPLFRWVNPLRAREPRRMHVDMSGTCRHVGEEFGYGLRYPGDPQAPPSQTINCHCYLRRVGDG